MSQASSPFAGQSAYQPPHVQMINSPLNPDTPPPPPPKPSSHETSRRGTPQQQHISPEGGYYGRDAHNPDSAHPSIFTSSHGDEPVVSGTLPPQQQQQQQVPDPPSIAEGWLPDIVKDKSLTDLKTLLSNPSLITALSTTHPSSISTTAHLHSLLAYNKDLATRLLELESHLAELRTATESLLLTHQSLEVSWRKKQAEMDAALAPWSPKGLYQRLSAAIAEQEAVCRAVEESFLEDDHHRLLLHHQHGLHGHDRYSDEQHSVSLGAQQGKASEKEVADWVRRVRSEAAKLAARREMKARWDEGRVGGWR